MTQGGFMVALTVACLSLVVHVRSTNEDEWNERVEDPVPIQTALVSNTSTVLVSTGSASDSWITLGKGHCASSTSVEPEYISCRVSSLEECQARCDGKILKSICQGVSYGSECRFYIDPNFSGALPHEYVNNTDCSLSTSTTRALITTAVAAAAPVVSPCYDEGWGYYDSSCSYTELCKCSGIVDANGLGSSCNPNSLTSSGQQWCYVDTACPVRTYRSPTDAFSAGSMPWATCPYASNPNSVPHCYTRRHCSPNSKRRGQWVQIGSSNVDQTVVYQAGARFSQSTTDVKTLTSEMKNDFSFNFLIVSGSTGSDTSRVITDAQSSSFNSDSLMSIQQDFGPGVVWQWQFEYAADCASATLFTHAAYLSRSAYEPPCCLPGLFNSEGCSKASEKDPVYNLCKAPAQPPAQDAGCFKGADDSSGAWVPISSSSGQQNITLHSAITSTHGSPAPPAPPAPPSSSTDFSSFLPIYWDNSNTQNTKNDVSKSSTNTTITQLQELYSFGPGVVWQWQLRSVDMVCSHSKLVGHDVRVTASLNAKPQCVPGYELSISHPEGPCKTASFDDETLLSLLSPSPSPSPPFRPPSPTPTPGRQNKNCKCLGYSARAVVAASAGTQCDPSHLLEGRQWCYVSSLCPSATATSATGHEFSKWAFCPPAFNDNSVPQAAMPAVGLWVPVSSSNGISQSFTSYFGTNYSASSSATSQTSFSVFASLSVSFSIGSLSFGGSLASVTSKTAGAVVGLYANAIKTRNTSLPASQTFGPGVVWQWQFQLGEKFDDMVVRGDDYRLTQSLSEPPCCLPGLDADITKPHGECLAAADGVVYTQSCKVQKATSTKAAKIEALNPSSYVQNDEQCTNVFGGPSTDASCDVESCDASRGPTNCVSTGMFESRCRCQYGYCAKDQVCHLRESCYNFWNHFPTPAGKWVLLASSTATQQRVRHYYGTTRVSSHGSSDTWTTALKLSLSVGFPFSAGPVSGKASLQVGASVSNALVTSTANAFAVTTNDTLSDSFGPGAIWQWQYVMPRNDCGNASVFTTHLRHTPSSTSPPCCLPGYEKDIHVPHSGCNAAPDGVVYDICSSESNTASKINVPVASQASVIAVHSATCVNTEQKGSWVMVGSSNKPQTAGFTQGSVVTRSSASTTESGFSVSLSITVSISVFSLGIGLSVANDLTNSVASTFSVGEQITVQQDFPAGVVWQWQYDIENTCGAGKIFTQISAHTADATQPPCCLPGHFDNSGSSCRKSSDGKLYNLCKAHHSQQQAAHSAADSQADTWVSLHESWPSPTPSPPYWPTPTPAPTQGCSKVIKQEAAWVPVGSSSSEQTLSYSLGRTTSSTKSAKSGSSSSLGFNIGVGFSVGPVHVSVGVAVGTNSAFTMSTDNTFQISSGQSFASTFGAGVVWQWQWSVQTECANHTVFAQDLRLTGSLEEPPCCLPGYEENISKPHGSCQATNSVTVSTCPSFPGTLMIPPTPAPLAPPATNWLKLGAGFCATQKGLQPKFVRCSAVDSALQCQQFCTHTFSGKCQGVNYATGSFSGFSWSGAEPASANDCYVYLKPGEEVSASLPNGCSVSSGSQPHEAIVTVQPPSSTSIECLVLEDNAQGTGQWQPIMSSNGQQSVSYQYGTVHTTANYYEEDSKSSDSWNIGITAFFLSVGLNGGSGMSNLNGHLSQTETTSKSSYSTELGSGVVWQWQLRFASSYREVIAHGKHLRLTDSLANPPCCLPGLESNIVDSGKSQDCLQTNLGKSQDLCLSPSVQPASVLGMESLSWLDKGHGMCATQHDSQPDHYDCTNVGSVLECTSLCQFSGVCAGVNFDGQICALYIDPQSRDPQLPASITNCQRAKGTFPQSAITGVNYGVAGTNLFAATSCLTLLNCSNIVHKTGEWVQLASSEGTNASTQVVSYQFGTEQASGTAHSKEFAHSAHNSFSLGFGWGAFGLSFGVSDASAQHSVALHRDAFFKTSAAMESLTFKAGTIWQFQFKASTPCGNATIRGKHLLLTDSTAAPPCCLPGMEVDLAKPHGKCRAASDGKVVDLCQHQR